jgi:hypothetical protein
MVLGRGVGINNALQTDEGWFGFIDELEMDKKLLLAWTWCGATDT